VKEKGSFKRHAKEEEEEENKPVIIAFNHLLVSN
jgi:hypothetical protein